MKPKSITATSYFHFNHDNLTMPMAQPKYLHVVLRGPLMIQSVRQSRKITKRVCN